jgi:transglutaminase-like putative cysteine protease
MHRFRLEYGWTTFWLVALLVFTATWSVQQAEWAEGLHILTPITILGLIVGLVLAHLRQIPPVAAHISAFLIGVVVVFFQMTTFLSDTLGTRREKLSWLWNRWESWYATIRGGESAEDLYLFILLMSAMLWVLSYAAVWFVFRSGWIWITLLLPGAIVLLNLGYSRHVSTFLLIVYLFTSFLLLMRFNFVQREKEWRKEGVPYPDSLVLRGFWTASYLAIVLILAAWLIPFSPQTDRAVAAWQNVNGPWERFENSFTDRFGSVLPGSGGGGGVGGFASFGSEFALGGSLRLSEEPVVFVHGENAPYLVAHRYDYFNGFGWESTVEQTYSNDEGENSTPPLLSFDADQEFPIPDSSRQQTRERTHQIEIIRPQGSIVLSGGETLRANIDTRVQAAWYTYEGQEIVLEFAEEGNTPPDLWNLVSLLKEADFSAYVDSEPAEGDATATPEATAQPDESSAQLSVEMLDGAARELYEDILEEQEELDERGIETEVTFDEDFRAESLTFSGSLPVFNDIEAVFASDVRSGDVYEVTSLVSEATADELRGASTKYPDEITRRYLQLPDETSPRVEELTMEIIRDLDNPYDKADAIEGWLRENLEYSEQINLPPEGVDFIEYFIFESKEGYCTYYATAMAQMLRMADVPSRVVVGYFPAAYDEEFGGAIYRDRNAHAWVEVYFPDYGWVDFEPTPSRSRIQRGGSADMDDPTGAGALAEAGWGENFPEDRFDFFEEEFAPGEMGDGEFVLGQEQSTSAGQWLMRGIAGVLLVAVGVMSYFWLRGLRGLTPAGQFYTRLQRGATWTGISAQPSMTPFEYARSIATAVPGSRTDAEYLADLYVRERYGNQRVASPDLTRARAAWLRLRGLFLRYALLYRWRRKSRRAD